MNNSAVADMTNSIRSDKNANSSCAAQFIYSHLVNYSCVFILFLFCFILLNFDFVVRNGSMWTWLDWLRRTKELQHMEFNYYYLSLFLVNKLQIKYEKM